jgi:hypothetical protein
LLDMSISLMKPFPPSLILKSGFFVQSTKFRFVRLTTSTGKWLN